MPKPPTISHFDYRTATADQIMTHARWLAGRSLGELNAVLAVPFDLASSHKGTVGHMVESYFGIPQNSRQEADFPAAGIELKILPVRVRSGGNYAAKERTVLSMIDYDSLVDENWPAASVRKKLNHILFVFYRDDAAIPMAQRRFLDVVEWRPTDDLEPTLRHDWETVQSKVRIGKADELSGRDSVLLEAATKGRDSSARVSQPRSDTPAKPRAWSLKAKFGTALLVLHTQAQAGAEIIDLRQRLAPKPGRNILDALLEHLWEHDGMTLGAISQRNGKSIQRGKAGAALFMRQVFGITRTDATFRELLELGVTVRTVRVSPRGNPYESTSFPYFDYFELADETWEDSELKSFLEQVLFIPLVGATKASQRPTLMVGRSFIWRPNDSEWVQIQHEWEMFRDLIRTGQANALPTAERTKIIHVRPHATNSSKKLKAPGGIMAQKSSFWLNREFVERLVRGADPERFDA